MRAFTRYLSALLGLVLLPSASLAADCLDWPAWEGFKQGFMSDDGRVIDRITERHHTVSEGQAYGALMALIANDRASFERILIWTRDNLARGDLVQNLPAWRWGRRDDGQWTVIDPNSASDADVWLAYALLEAGRLWAEPRYTELADRMLANITRSEVVGIPGLGYTLLPAPVGFAGKESYRLNPSYLAPQVLRRFATYRDDMIWRGVLASSRRVLLEGAPRGVAPDWLIWKPGIGFEVDEISGGVGSYDAIRVYLWIGMLHKADPYRGRLLARYSRIARLLSLEGSPPETIDTRSGLGKGTGPGGFSAALLPFLATNGGAAALGEQKVRLSERSAEESGRYYDQILRLFGTGWDEGRFRFGADGGLQPRWLGSCSKP